MHLGFQLCVCTVQVDGQLLRTACPMPSAWFHSLQDAAGQAYDAAAQKGEQAKGAAQDTKEQAKGAAKDTKDQAQVPKPLGASSS